MTFDMILITTDGSDPADAAARLGFDLATECGATVHVLSVADSRLTTSASLIGDSPPIGDRLHEEAEQHVAALEADARARDIEVVSAVRAGSPATEIVDYANDAQVDAIAMGTHGRRGVTRLLVGSVADRVVRTSSVPVLTVRSNETTRRR